MTKKNNNEVAITLNVAAVTTDEERREARERVNAKMVTQWLRRGDSCGASSYNAKTNQGWCNCEVARLKNRKVRAGIVTRSEWCAVFKLDGDETPSDIADLIEKAGININDNSNKD